MYATEVVCGGSGTGLGNQGSARGILMTMRRFLLRVLMVLVAAMGLAGASAGAQTQMDAFHWVNFHDAKDEPTVAWVSALLRAEKWTAIREIGVEYDAAIVETVNREQPQGNPAADVYTFWSVGLATKQVQLLLRVSNPRVVDWTSFSGLSAPELGLIYDDCSQCAATTYFTTLYYNPAEHGWRARWVRGNQAAALHVAGHVDGVEHTEVYGVLTEHDGRQVLGTWDHFDYGKAKPAEDFVYEYSVDALTGLEQTHLLADPHSATLELRLCQIDPLGGARELTAGQDSPLCQDLVKANAKPERRRPVTTPPANNQGKSVPGGNVKAAVPKIVK